MLANFLNKSKPINFIGLLILFFFGYLFTFITSYFIDGFSFDTLLKGVGFFLFFLFIFFFFNFIITKNRLTHDNSLGFFLFIAFTFSILPELLGYETLLLMLFYLLFLRKIYSLKSANNVLEKLFDSGFWLGVFFLFEPQAILFILFIYFAIYIHHKITIHSIFVPIIGFVIPLFLYFTYFFWFDDTKEFTKLFNFDININYSFYNETKYYWFILSILLLSVFAMILKSIKTLTINNTFRRSWVLLMLHFFLSFLYLSIFENKNGAEVLFVLFPISIILANGIELIKKRLFKNIVLYGILSGCILFYTLL